MNILDAKVRLLFSLAIALAACGSPQPNPTTTAANDAAGADTQAVDSGRSSGDAGADRSDASGGASSDANGEAGSDTAGADGQIAPNSTPPSKVHTVAKYEVVTTTKIVYAKGLIDASWGTKVGTETTLMLDTYAPKDHPGGLKPALILIHGGGFVGGTRLNGAIVAQAKYFAARGWFTASISYRLAGAKGPVPKLWAAAAAATPIPDVVKAMYTAGRDAKAAVRWLHANATKLGVHPDHIAIGGGSAGAYTAIGVGVSKPEDLRDELTADEDPTLATTHLQASAKVAAIVDYWGGAGMLTALATIDGGKTRFDAGDPPIAIIHGTADNVVAFSEAENLKKQYTSTGAAFVYHPLEGAGHSAWNATVGGKSLTELSFAFLVEKQGLVTAP